MRYIDNTCIDPYFNLALDEYLLKEKNDEYFVLWRNEPCIVVGKNQNTLSEINVDYVKTNNIKVVRRQSGGGAVFHDLGNLNFTFIVRDDGESFTDFEKFLQPIMGVLRELGIKAEFSGRNDLLIDGKKVVGNAQCKHRNRMMHHGCILFSVNMNNLSGALISKPVKFSDKAVKSVVSRVTNISEHLRASLTVEEFKTLIFEYITKNDKNAVIERLSEREIRDVENLKKSKYETWKWNFGQSPKYDFYNEKKFTGGTVEASIKVEKGIIKDVKIFGDFFGKEDVGEIEKSLIGKNHEESEIKKVLSNFQISEYFSNIKEDEILNLLIK